MSSSGPWWASSLIAIVGSVLGVVLTLAVTGRRESRSQFNKEKRTVYANVLLAGAAIRDAAVWLPASQPGVDTATLLDALRTAAMDAVLTADQATGQHLAGVRAAAEQLATEIEDVRRTSKPGYHGSVDERHRGRYQEARATLSKALTEFTKAARRDLNVRTDLHDPFPINGHNT